MKVSFYQNQCSQNYRNKNYSYPSISALGGTGSTLSDSYKISEKFNEEVVKVAKNIGKAVKNLFKN